MRLPAGCAVGNALCHHALNAVELNAGDDSANIDRFVERRADPQTGTATQLVAWASFGYVRPTDDDFKMFRVLLLAVVPQISGLLLMISRSA